VEIEPPEEIAADWCDDDSILGDFLRTVRDHMESDAETINLQANVPQRPLPRALRDALSALDAEEAVMALREAAVLGADMLRGEDSTGRSRPMLASHAEPEGVPT
jgi:hypothetical protein